MTNERVLIVDDDGRNRTLLRCWLEPRYRVTEVADGPSALAAVDGDPPDLVLLDVMMPGMSGYDVCREVKRRRGDGPFLPVILLTALTEQSERNEGLRAGADDFLSKPCDRVELGLRVEAFLRTRRQDVLIRTQMNALAELGALKDDLVALVTHDLRNPLSALQALLTVARGETGDPELRADLDASLAAAARVRDTAEALLDVRALEEGRLPVRRAPASVEAIVRSAMRPFRAAERHRGVVFRLTVEGDSALPVDAELVRRAIENLLSNAARHAPDRGEISVIVRRCGTAIEIDVADRGPGIASEVRPVLFEKFGALEARAHHARRGHGLGLYLVGLVARAHGGTASVHEPEGGGALFRLRLEEDGCSG